MARSRTEGVLPNTDVNYVTNTSGFSENIILKSSDASGTVSYRILTDALSLQQLEDGSVGAMDDDVQVAAFPPGSLRTRSTDLLPGTARRSL